MTADPRVEVVAEALSRYPAAEPFTPAALAPVAVAALDAYDAPKFSSVVHECCERPTEADLRERIAREIDDLAVVVAEDPSGQMTSPAEVAHWLRRAADGARGAER